VGAVVVFGLTCYVAIEASPWPSALFIRRTMNNGGYVLAKALEKHVSTGVVAHLNQQYDETDADAYLDVFTTLGNDKPGQGLPTIVWVHGGGWLAGDKNQIANYLKVLAARGYTTVGVNYSLAPGKVYPTPVRQVNTALAYITRDAARFNIDATKLFLAGDSSGAQIAAQLAAIINTPDYAKDVGISASVNPSQLLGIVLYCGFYDAEFKKSVRPWLWSNVKTMLWSYIGTKNFLVDPRLVQFSILNHITANFPPAFISVGNGDDLAPQSYALADIAKRLEVRVDSLFFPSAYTPPVSHEFQFDLDQDAGRVALEKSISFLASLSGREQQRK
jgi:acetyl esterase